MSTTWITTIKVAGPCCSDLANRVDKWHEAARQRTEAMESLWALHSPMTDATEIEIRRLLTLLEAHATRPPVVFFSRHLDAWTMAHEFWLKQQLQINDLPRTVTCNDMTLFFLSLDMEEPTRDRLSKLLTESASGAQFEETRMLFMILRQCLVGWHALLEPHSIPSALLLFIERVGGSWMDREVVAESSTIPEWLPKLSWASDPVR
jgi:hypothetical protein